MLDKIRDDVKCDYDYDVFIAWVVSAKNALINHNGFSSAQLVLEKLPIYPVPLMTIY